MRTKRSVDSDPANECAEAVDVYGLVRPVEGWSA